MLKIDVSGLADAVTDALEEYADAVMENAEEAAEEAAKDAVQELRGTSPKKTGKYAKSWAQKKTRDGKGRVVYSRAPDYRKTHLLEKGHAKRGGGRVAAIPHIRPAEQNAIKEFEEKIRRKL